MRIHIKNKKNVLKKNLRKYISAAVSVAVFLCVMLFWLCVHPEWLNYHEQNQLFLFSWSYFVERLSLPGGLADWMGEFLVQFYYVPALGAAVLGLLAVVLQRTVAAVLRVGCSDCAVVLRAAMDVLSVLPVAVLVWVSGDENVLLSYTVALQLSLTSFLLMRRLPWTAGFAAVPVLWWLAGPVAVVYVALRIIYAGKKEWLLLAWLVVVTVCAYRFLLTEYPFEEVVFGISYYRIPIVLLAPKALLIVPVLLTAMFFVLENRHVADMSAAHGRTLLFCSIALLAVVAVSAVVNGFPKDKYEMLRQDALVRQGRWSEIIARAERQQPHTAFSSNAVNLALAMTGQLADRQFTFWQSGEDALIMPSVRDNMSDLPSAEAFWQLGMVNSARRYMYDIQESILNGRRSGRCMKRIAECLVADGQYGVARKYLDVLRQSLFYGGWARQTEAMLGNEALIAQSEDYGRVRRFRYRINILYSYDQIDKMFGLLFAGNTDNKLALSYFMGDMLLKGKAREFYGYMAWVQRYGGYAAMPAGYADALGCFQSHGQKPGAYSEYAARMMSGQQESSGGQ